jgi:hypothetical protein
MLGYTAAEVINRITPADISDPQELIARAKALSSARAPQRRSRGGPCICPGMARLNGHDGRGPARPQPNGIALPTTLPFGSTTTISSP